MRTDAECSNLRPVPHLVRNHLPDGAAALEAIVPQGLFRQPLVFERLQLLSQDLIRIH